MADEFLTAKAVAKMLAVAPKRVYQLGIPRVVIGKRTYRWRLSDVREWVEKRRCQ